MKKQIFVASSLFCLIVAFIGMRALSLWPQFSAPQPDSTPTKEITSNSSIGGVAINIDTPQAKLAPKGTPPPDSTSNSKPAPQATATTNDLAPKQTEVAKSIHTEYPYYALGSSNDPLTQNSWALTNTKAQFGWDTSTGNRAIVAVIDTGFALDHEDLVNQWYKNDGELGTTASGERCWTGTAADKSTNSCDDDNNGYIDDWRGWDFVGRTNSPQAGRTNPTGQGVAHGTEVAGLVGATGNNGKGIATFGWNTQILPLQVLSDDGSGYTSSIAAAIYYAVDRGVQVINMSLGGDSPDPALSAAIQYAYDHKVVVVAAAGNCGTGTEAGCDPAKPGAMGYPALDKHVIAVGATTSNNTRASFSSYGPGLDVMAPGSGAIASTMWTPTNQTSAYASSLYGTSFASPMVAGYVALIKAIRPASSVNDITALVDGTAAKVSSMNGLVYTAEYGHGLIDTATALSVASALGTPTTGIELLQTGSNYSEHSFNSMSTLASGCKTTTTAYCTVWAVNDAGFDRYLPYTNTGQAAAGWSWSGSVLSSDVWYLRARSGDVISSTPYILFQK